MAGSAIGPCPMGPTAGRARPAPGPQFQ